MADTVKLPGMGEVSKKEATIFGVIFVLVIGVAYYRHSKNQTASSATAATAVDPNTGYPQGSAQDMAVLQAQQNTASSGYYGGGGGGGGGGSDNVPGGGPPSNGTGFVSNSQWAQAVEDYLVNTVNQGDQTKSNTISAAVGKYLTGQPMTPDQISIVEQAIAFEGLPPVAGANGFPPSFHTATTTGGQPPSNNGGGTTSTGLPSPGHVIYGPWMIQGGQTLATVAARFGLTTSQIITANPGLTWTPGRVIRIPWLVKPGQTLDSVATVFEIPPAQLAAQMTQ